MSVNKNISVWRGNVPPPTDYHLWLKKSGSLYMYIDDAWVQLISEKMPETLESLAESIKKCTYKTQELDSKDKDILNLIDIINNWIRINEPKIDDSGGVGVVELFTANDDGGFVSKFTPAEISDFKDTGLLFTALGEHAVWYDPCVTIQIGTDFYTICVNDDKSLGNVTPGGLTEIEVHSYLLTDTIKENIIQEALSRINPSELFDTASMWDAIDGKQDKRIEVVGESNGTKYFKYTVDEIIELYNSNNSDKNILLYDGTIATIAIKDNPKRIIFYMFDKADTGIEIEYNEGDTPYNIKTKTLNLSCEGENGDCQPIENLDEILTIFNL